MDTEERFVYENLEDLFNSGAEPVDIGKYLTELEWEYLVWLVGTSDDPESSCSKIIQYMKLVSPGKLNLVQHENVPKEQVVENLTKLLPFIDAQLAKYTQKIKMFDDAEKEENESKQNEKLQQKLKFDKEERVKELKLSGATEDDISTLSKMDNAELMLMKQMYGIWIETVEKLQEAKQSIYKVQTSFISTKIAE